MDMARLGLAVDSSQVEKGTTTLHQFTGAAGQASAAAKSLAGASQIEAAGQKAATVATQAHNAALMAQNTVIRSSMQQRTMMIYQLNDVGVSLASGMNPMMVAIQQGSQILQGGFAPALRTITDLTVGFVAKFWPVAAAMGAASAAIGGLSYEINKAGEVQVGFFDVALAGWQLFTESIKNLVSPVFGQIGQWMVDGWEAAAPVLKDIGNTIIGTFVGSFEAVKATWGALPGAIGDFAYQAADNLVFGVQMMVRNVQVEINKFLAGIDQALLSANMPTLGLNVGAIDPQHIDNPFAGQAAGVAGAASNAFSGAQKDYMGDMFGALSERAQAIALARKETEDLGGAAKAANDNFTKLADQGLGNLVHWTEAFGNAAKSAFSNLGSGIVEAFKKGGDVAGNVLDMLMDKVGQFGESLLNNGLNGLLNMGLGALGGMFGGGTWGVAGGFSGFSGIFGIPGMASGGTVGREGLSWVGEQGPELLRLPQGAQVIPNGPSMSMAANSNSGASVTIHNTITVPSGTSADVAPAIAREVTKELRRQIPDAIEKYNRNPLRRAS